MRTKRLIATLVPIIVCGQFFIGAGAAFGQSGLVAPSKGHLTEEEVAAFDRPGHAKPSGSRAASRSVVRPSPRPVIDRDILLLKQRRTFSRAGTVYTSADFAAMSTASLITAVATTDYNGIRALWTFDADVVAVIAESKVDAFVTQILSEISDLSGNADRIYQMLVYLHICGYHEFWQASISYSNTMHDTVDGAMQSIGAEGDFLTNGASLALLRQEWCVAADAWESLLEVLPALDALLLRYNANPSLQTDYDETFTMYYLFGGVTRDMWNNTVLWENVLSSTFIAETGVIANDTNMDPDADYLIGWAMYALGLTGWLDATTIAAAHPLLSDAYAAHTPYELNWLYAVMNLEAYYNSTLFDSTVLDVAQIRQTVEDIAFTNQFALDGGNLIFETPLSGPVINDLYDALQEVESQYHRLSTFLDPVPGDTNEVLTMRIYGSRADYDTYQFFLYGLNTNNGGIYIESWGTFFTYQRTPQESIYTLEELTRHEYLHYLDSRFGIEGSWGEAGTLYDGNRMVWFDEGLAEFIAGSTRDQGVLPRRSLVQGVAGDGGARLSIANLVGSTYSGGFKFYRYGGTFFNFLYEYSAETYGIFTNLMKVIRSNDAGAVDAAFAALESDTQLQTYYTQYLDQLVLDEPANARPFWDDVPTAHVSGVAGSNSTELLQVIQAHVTTNSPSLITTTDRFIFSDAVAFNDGNSPPDEVDARLTWDSFLDGLLVNLGITVENFVSATAWFGDLLSSGNDIFATYFIEGPYSATSTLVADAFDVDDISPSQFVGETFPVAVEAVTQIGSLVTDFSGNANLYAYQGLGGRELSIGNGTIEWTHPFNTNAHENRTQVIYTAAEIGEAGTLGRLALDVATLPDGVMNNWTIRMQHTTMNSYPIDGSAQWQSGGWTTVLQEAANVASTGWVWFEFDTTFAYNGVDNLMVDFSFDNASYGDRGYGNLTNAGSTRVLSAYAYGEYGSPQSWTASTPTPEPTPYVPNVIFSGGSPLSVSPSTIGFSSGSWAGNVTISEAGDEVRIFVDDGSGHTGTSGAFSVVVATGSVRVTIAPQAAIDAGAAWQLDSDGVWRTSGAKVSVGQIGSHTVTFKPLGGWDAPYSRSVNVVQGQNASDAGTYVMQGGFPKADIWVDFLHTGSELGTSANPFNTLEEGLVLLQPGGTIHFFPGSDGGAFEITGPVTLRLNAGSSGKARIGVSP